MGKRKAAVAEIDPVEDEELDENQEPEEGEGPEIPGELEVSDDELVKLVAGLLFASPDPLPAARLSKLIFRRKTEVVRIEEALESLSTRLEKAGLPIEVRTIAGGAVLLTDSEISAEIARLLSSRKVERMTPAGLETLAVIAYRQPVTKGEIEAIRGVQAGPVLRNLVDRDLVKVTGRADQPGNPLQYGTTGEFLDRFGLPSLEELPRDPELLRE